MHRIEQDSDGLRWETPWLSKADPDCVDVAELPDGGARVRNSNGGPVVEFTESEWLPFLASVRAGQYGKRD